MNGARRTSMEPTWEEVLGNNVSGTDARHNQNPLKSDGKASDAGNVRVFSVDRVTVEKIVLESSNGTREVLLTKNETSRKLSLSSETKPSVVKRTKDGGGREKSSVNGRFRVSVPEDTFTSKAGVSFESNLPVGQSKLSIPRCRKSGDVSFSNGENRIKPIRLTKSSSIGSIVVEGLNSSDAIARKHKVPPRVPEKPANKREHNSSLIAQSVFPTKVEPCEDLSPSREKVADQTVAEIKQGQSAEQGIFEAEKTRSRKTDVNNISPVEIKRDNESPGTANEDCVGTDEIGEQRDTKDSESREECTRVDKDAQDRLERSQTAIENLQKNLSRIHSSTAQSYKEKLLDLQANYALRPITVDANSGDGLSCEFDKDFLEKHNLDKRLKIEEKRLLETDLDYISDNDRSSEIEDQASLKVNPKRIYSEKVTEVEKRWSGEFLENQLQHNSSESSRSSYVEEFGSVSSRESIVEDCDSRLLFDRKRSVKFAERQVSTDESKRLTSEEILEDTTVSTVDSDSCLEDRIKAVDEDIARATNGVETDDNDDIDEFDHVHDDDENAGCVRWHEKVEEADSTVFTTTAIIHENGSLRQESDSVGTEPKLNEAKSNFSGDIETREAHEKRISEVTDNERFLTEGSDGRTLCAFTVVNSEESADPVQSHCGRDGYANLIKEFTMEAGSPKKEEKQKKRLGFRCLLPAIFSPKDSRKDCKKKEQKERKRYDERHFARYQQNGNYTRSPDTMNLNEDIKRNVKLDNSLNGSIIEERLDEIKRELFPEQGPITSTPDHFLQTDDSRLLRDRVRTQRSYTTDSSLSSIAPDDRWMDRSGHLGISPDVKKYEQRQKREEQERRRYGQLERKHSLQEPNHSNRNCYFQRNHAPSGRISAPPGERYLVRPRAIHPVDRPLPEIPQSQADLSNYENYQDSVEPLCDGRGYHKDTYAVDNVDYQNQPGLYQNDRDVEVGLVRVPQSVPAQVKITRQLIVNQTQRAPLVGRNPKYPSPGSSQKSGDYADSSCTPNSSQKSEFSPSSSKSGEYYLHSPRSSARTSPAERPFDDARERIYENETHPATSQPPNRYVDEHVYDETPSSPCHEERPMDSKVPTVVKGSPEKRDNPIYDQRCSPSRRSPSKSSRQQSPQGKETAGLELKRETEKLHGDHSKSPVNSDLKNEPLLLNQAERTCLPNVSPSKAGVALATSPSAGLRALARKSQPNDQILIASPKRDAIYQSRVSRPLNETRLCDVESPVPIADSRECMSGIVPIEARDQYGSQDSSVSVTAAKSTGQKVVSSSAFPKGISRPEPIYGHRKQQSSPTRGNATVTSEVKEDRPENDRSPRGSYKPAESSREVDERLAWVEGQTPRNPQARNPEAKQTPNELGKKTARSPAHEPPSTAKDLFQQRGVIQQRASSVTSASSSEGQQSSPMTSQDKVYVGANLLGREAIYEQRQRQQSQQQPRQLPEPVQRPRQSQETMYVQRGPDSTYAQQCYPTCGPLSPSKRETRQHLEAFYWQQKALEAQRKSVTSSASPGPRQVASKINLPEVREAVWQQLKKLDEEQQRRIYEQNLLDDSSYETYCRTRTASPTTLPPGTNQTFNPNATASTAVVHGEGPCWGNVQQAKMSPSGKLPLMYVPKGQNQPVLIVRPQQALRDRQEISIKSVYRRDPVGRDTPRSKSASPHFHRGEFERSSVNVTRTKPVTDADAVISLRKPEEEDTNDGEGRPRPHPIFKRGSLVGGESAEYGSAGPKRVSFSNQPNAGPDPAAGSWPTKHGTAPEPPTRRHRSEDSTSDTDSVFLHQDRRDVSQEALYAARSGVLPSRCRIGTSEQDYDANKPLPPLPKDRFVISCHGNGARNLAYGEPRWGNEEHRRRRQGE